MIPEEGRVSHISFEQDKKLSARRYYDLRTTVINSMRGYTNIITIASQPPAWFFSPKALTLSFKECLREINYCDNSSFRNDLRQIPTLSYLNCVITISLSIEIIINGCSITLFLAQIPQHHQSSFPTPFAIPKTQPMRRCPLPGVPWVVAHVA